MKVPHQRSSRIVILVFAVILASVCIGMAISADSVLPCILLIFWIFTLYLMGRIACHVEIIGNELVFYNVYCSVRRPVHELRRIAVNSGDEGTITFYFSRGNIKLAQHARGARQIVQRLLLDNSDVDFQGGEH
ncbi:MAG: hypothetical protein AAF226_06485 [Verrucomicrobiota bacterium]